MKSALSIRLRQGRKSKSKDPNVIREWVKVLDDVWKVTLPNFFFGGFNPYSDTIHGDWFDPLGRRTSYRSRLSQRRLAE